MDQKFNISYILGISLVSALGGFLFGYDWVVIGGAKFFYERFFEITDIPQLQGLAMSSALIYAGNPVDGAEFIKKAMRLDPHYPPDYLHVLGKAQFFSGRYDDALATFEEVIRRNPETHWTYIYLAATYGHLGREPEAKSAIKTFTERVSEAESGIFLSLQRIDRSAYKERKDVQRLREGLRIAGVPEHPPG